MNPLAQREKKKKKKKRERYQECCFSSWKIVSALWLPALVCGRVFCRPVISRVRGVSHHFSLHAKVGGVHFMFCVNNVLPQEGKEIH